MDAFFEYVIGDQCLLGQHDRESGMPMRGRTKWGTNAFHLKQMLSAVCEGGHEHQQIMGSNCFGPRSQQKAEWPLEMCRHILRAIIKELKLRTVQRLFAVESAREEAEELGPLDGLDDDAPMSPGHIEGADAPTSTGHLPGFLDDASEIEGPAIGSRISGGAEREQELLDSLRLSGFPMHEQQRREE